MNICLVNLDFRPTRTSGLAIYGELLADGLVAAGHDVTMIASERRPAPTTPDRERIRVVRVPIGPTDWIGFSFRAARTVSRLQQQQRYDIVHFLDLHFAYAYPGPFVASAFQTFRQRLVARGNLPYHHSLLNLALRYSYYKAAKVLLERRAAMRAGRILAASPATHEACIANYPRAAARTLLVPSGIDLQRYGSSGGLRQRLGLDRELVLLYVGFSTPRKGLEYLARAVQGLQVDWRLIIVGKWERGYRKQFYRALSPPDRKRVIETGYVADEELPAYYSTADIFVLPSLLEGFGQTLVEAMASGVPILSTNAGSIPGTVGDAGILVPPMDVRALAEALTMLSAHPDIRKELGRRGMLRARQLFSSERMVVQTLEAYQSFLKDER